MRVRYYVAASLDGFIATPDGGVEWLNALPPEETGYAEFLAGIAGLVMGRATCEVSLSVGPWPYGERPAVVLTHRPLPAETPAWVEALAGTPAEALAALAARGVTGDVWLVGGAAVATAFLEAGLLDTVEVAIIPILLGRGIPLFSGFDGHRALAPVSCKALKSGMILTEWQVAK